MQDLAQRRCSSAVSLAQVLRYCHTCPRVIEALMNSYDHVRVSEEWVEAVPAEVVQVRECVLLAGEHAAGLRRRSARGGTGLSGVWSRAGAGWRFAGRGGSCCWGVGRMHHSD